MGYTDIQFEQDVIKRENAASTAFGNIAIPHSINMNAVKTSISIAISEEGFLWNACTVHLVFLMTINKADKKIFQQLYESLISLFDDDSLMHSVKICRNFKEFKALIFKQLG